MYKTKHSGNRLWVCLFLGLAYALMPVPVLGTEPNTDGHIGIIVSTQGKVFAKKHRSIRTLARKHFIYLNEQIETADRSRARIKFTDGTLLTLGSDTVFQVNQFDPNAAKANMDFVRGAFRVVTHVVNQVKKPDFKVHTPLGSIGIRGTDFWGGNLYNQQEIDVLLISSQYRLSVSNQVGQVELLPGQGTTLRKGQAPAPAKKWPAKKVADAVKTIEDL